MTCPCIRAIRRFTTGAMLRTKRPRTVVSRLTTVRNSRVGVTVVTSSFANGDHGPLFINVSPGSISEAAIQRLNEEFAGCALIATSGTNTHFMNSESTWVMFEKVVAKAFARQRTRHGLWGRVGLLLADAFGGNHGQSFAVLRNKFAATHDILLPAVQPGGWSAHGQPQVCAPVLCSCASCAFLRALVMSTAFGAGPDPWLLQRPQRPICAAPLETSGSEGPTTSFLSCDVEICIGFRGTHAVKRPVVLRLSINTTGQLERATDVEEAIRCAVKNYGLVPRELLQQAWVKTGYATWEELCSLDEAAAGQEEAERLGRQADPHGFSDILGPDAAGGPVPDDRLQHEKFLIWQIQDPETQAWSLLPQAGIRLELSIVREGFTPGAIQLPSPCLDIHEYVYIYIYIYTCMHTLRRFWSLPWRRDLGCTCTERRMQSQRRPRVQFMPSCGTGAPTRRRHWPGLPSTRQ